VSFAIRVPIPLHRAIAVIAGAALMVFVVGTAVFMVRDVQQKRAERRDLARQRAVRVLPAGAREAWVAYVHGRVAKAMTRTAQDVSLIQTGSGAQRIPFGTPFDVECDTMAGSGAVIFRPGRQAVVVPVYGSGAKQGQTPEPPLGVLRQSPAAIGLSDLLCKTIVDDVRAITGRPSSAPEQG
jgi:hypothetical protein